MNSRKVKRHITLVMKNEHVNGKTHGCQHQNCMPTNCSRVGYPPPCKKGATTLQLMKGSVLLQSSWIGLVGMHREVCDLFTGVYLGSLPARQHPHLAWSHQRLYLFHCCLHPHPPSAGLWNVVSLFGGSTWQDLVSFLVTKARHPITSSYPL